MMKRVLLLCAICLELAFAIEIQLIAPVDQNIWSTGQNVSVSWRYDSLEASGGNNITQIDIDLVKGDPNNVVDNISFGVPVPITAADWYVSDKVEGGVDYMVRFTSVEDKSFRFVGPKFTIVSNMTGTRKNPAPPKLKPDLLNVPNYLYLALVALLVLF